MSTQFKKRCITSAADTGICHSISACPSVLLRNKHHFIFVLLDGHFRTDLTLKFRGLFLTFRQRVSDSVCSVVTVFPLLFEILKFTPLKCVAVNYSFSLLHKIPCVGCLLHAKLLSHVQLFATLWTIARQTPLTMGFSRQEYWSRLPCPPPGDLLDPGIKPWLLTSPALADGFFTTSAT